MNWLRRCRINCTPCWCWGRGAGYQLCLNQVMDPPTISWPDSLTPPRSIATLTRWEVLFLDPLYDSGYTASIVLLRTFICARSTCAFHRVQWLFPHVTWGMQCDKSSWWMGCAMLYNALYNPWTMGGENIVQPHHQWEINCPWVMGCTMDMGVTPDHGSWIVQQYTHPMVHGLYNSISTPWVMDCTTVYMLHDPWVVQWYTYPMAHGLYNSLGNICTPWSMDCTMVCMLHDPWVVQWYVLSGPSATRVCSLQTARRYWLTLYVRATLPPSTLFADRVLLHRGYSISEPNTWGETVSKPLGLILGLVYNLSRLQLTRQSLHSIAKREWHRWICQPWWALQAIKRWIGCRSAVWLGCGWVGREWGGVLKVLAVEQTSS